MRFFIICLVVWLILFFLMYSILSKNYFWEDIFKIVNSSITNIVSGNLTNYTKQGIGSFVLSNSLLGLSLVIAIYAILLNHFDNLNKKRTYNDIPNYLRFWVIPTVGFIYAIAFSMIKLIVWDLNEIERRLGDIAFIYFFIGVFSFIFWLVYSTNKLNQQSKK